MSSDVVQKTTGESVKGLLIMAAGAAVVAVLVAPYIQKYLGISATLALILGGAVLAYFGKGLFRQIGQGAALFGVTSWAVAMIAPLLSRMNPLAGKAARDPLFA